ncbi:uncharacterized protein DUF1612 [Sinorhizobium medicae]|nr:uncharacterized protein DUF1612 [Sinorhizobium medicae]
MQRGSSATHNIINQLSFGAATHSAPRTPAADIGRPVPRSRAWMNRSRCERAEPERSHFADASASLWIDGDFVHLEDLVLHDVASTFRAPTHEQTIASDVLKTRRRIVAHPAGWAFSPDGLRRLREQGAGSDEAGEGIGAVPSIDGQPVAEAAGGGEGGAGDVRSVGRGTGGDRRCAGPRRRRYRPPTRRGREKDCLVYDLDRDEDERLDESRLVLTETEALPPVLQAVLLRDAWNDLQFCSMLPGSVGRWRPLLCERQD